MPFCESEVEKGARRSGDVSPEDEAVVTTDSPDVSPQISPR